jgi:hypothetical protein
MTGMKEGAGEDPFAENDESEEPEAADPPGTDEKPSAPTETVNRQQSPQHESMQIPYKFRRDGVQDGRDRVPLFLQDDTKSAERDALRELENRFDDDVSLTDLREALVMAGLQHLDEVEGQLEQWGYGMTFSE